MRGPFSAFILFSRLADLFFCSCCPPPLNYRLFFNAMPPTSVLPFSHGPKVQSIPLESGFARTHDRLLGCGASASVERDHTLSSGKTEVDFGLGPNAYPRQLALDIRVQLMR